MTTDVPEEFYDFIAFLLCFMLLPLYPLFYLIDYVFDTQIMYNGAALDESPGQYECEMEEKKGTGDTEENR